MPGCRQNTSPSHISTFLNLSNIISISLSSMPIPLSFTDISTNSSLFLTSTNISSPSFENYIAFDIRFNTILSIFSGSHAIISSSTSVSKIIFKLLLSIKSVIDNISKIIKTKLILILQLHFYYCYYSFQSFEF